MNDDEKFDLFFKSKKYAVIGASTKREKYGNKVLRCYMQHGKDVIPVNPVQDKIEGLDVIQNIQSLPNDVKSISIITSPAVTTKVVKDAILKGIKNIWMQPGAESVEAINECNANNINVIANGPCILVYLGFKDV